MSVVDEIRARGGLRMIPTEVCRSHRIGADRVLNVLLAAAELVDHRAIAYPSLRTLEERTGVNRRDVQTALDVLVEAAILVPAGRREKSNAYLLDVDRWSDPLSGDPRIPLSGEPSGGSSGGSSGEPSGDPRNKRRGQDNRGGDADEVDTPMPVIHKAPAPCRRHPHGWDHEVPCRRCADLRVYAEQQQTAVVVDDAPRCLTCSRTESQCRLAVEIGTADRHDFSPTDAAGLAAVEDRRASGAAHEKKDPMRSHHVDDDLAAFIDQQTAGLRELHDRRYGT